MFCVLLLARLHACGGIGLQGSQRLRMSLPTAGKQISSKWDQPFVSYCCQTELAKGAVTFGPILLFLDGVRMWFLDQFLILCKYYLLKVNNIH